MRVLGVDPGTYKMGVGVVDSEGSSLTAVHYDVLAPPRREPISSRLHYLYEALCDKIGEWMPADVAVEQPFVGRNVKSAISIGQAEAAAMMAAAKYGLPVSTYAPRQVKQAVTDYGGSSKEQVQGMVAVLLGLHSSLESSDAADALAVALCHISTIEANTAMAL